MSLTPATQDTWVAGRNSRTCQSNGTWSGSLNAEVSIIIIIICSVCGGKM